jgi:anti-sigma factor RsiW
MDGELDANAVLQFQLHVSECGSCTEILQRLQMRREMIRRAGLSYRAPAGLEARIRKGIRNEQRSGFHWRTWGAVAAALLLAGSISIPFVRSRAAAEFALDEEVISSHVRAALTGHSVDVASSDRHSVKPWFNGRLDFSPPVTDLASQGFPLVGGRVDYIKGRSVAALVYQRRKHTIDLFIWPSQSGEAGKSEFRKGYHVIRWSGGGMSFAAVSDLNKAELDQFKTLLSGR